MPFSVHPGATKIQFATATELPMLISKARALRGYTSNTQYVQRVLARAVADDLGIDYEDLLARMPPTRQRYDQFNPPSVPAETVK